MHMPEAHFEGFDLDQLDQDGAIREADAAITGDSRADFLKKAAVGGGAMIGGGALLGALPSLAAAAPSAKQDIAILNYALTLEYLESAFYREALSKGAIKDPIVLNVTKVVSAHEDTHVRYLKKALGSKAVKKPKFDFKGTTSDEKKFLATAVTLEDTGVKAYSGQGTRIKSPAIVNAAISILVIEARHASRFRALNGNKFAPSPFGSAASMSQVLSAVKKTGFIKS
jgi:rubrerythrin